MVKYEKREQLAPLSGTVPREAYLDTPQRPPPVCPHSTLPLFNEAAVEQALAAAENVAPQAFWLPPHLAETVKTWARVGDVVKMPPAPEVRV